MPDESIDQLYRCHAPAVFRRALKLLGTRADAHEVVQELFLGLFERPEQYAGKSSITTFLYAATTHACINRLRNHRNRQRLLEQQMDGATVEPARQLSPEQALLLRRSLSTMPDELARVLVYHCVDGMSHQEIAGLLACSRRHVGNLLERANEWSRGEETETC